MRQRRTSPTTAEENHTWLLVRQTTTKIQSPTPAGGILIDHWAREIIHGCWSGDAPKAHKSNNGKPKPVAPEADKLYGGRHINRTLGEENRLELLVRRCAKGAQVQQRRGKSFIVVGQAMRQRRTSPTTAIQSPSRLRRTSSTAGGILIDHWARKIIHSCWSGDAPKAHKSNNGEENRS